jgi:hypothetical protein
MYTNTIETPYWSEYMLPCNSVLHPKNFTGTKRKQFSMQFMLPITFSLHETHTSPPSDMPLDDAYSGS